MACSRSGHLVHVEPNEIEILEALPEIGEKFTQEEWYGFCNTFQGHHTGVSMDFAESFDGFQAQVGNLTIQVSEHSISSSFSFPIDGERWFKKKEIPEKTYAISSSLKIIKIQNGAREFLSKWLKEEWRNTLPVVQKYITCEGRFATTYRYHMRFLLHLNGNNRMNLPFFLLKSLTKMANKIQTHPKNAQYSLFHQGLIKVLVMQELNKNQTTWEQFFVLSGFETQGTEKNSCNED
jgi:hypothetical protein